MISAAGARTLFGVLLVIVLAIALVISSLAGRPTPDPRSARSAEPTGRLAAALLLEELGLESRRFEAAPIALPLGSGLLWMPGPPELPTHLLTGADEAEGPALDDPRHGLFYRRFVVAGGTLVIPATPFAGPFLEEVLGIERPPRARRVDEVRTEARLPGGETVTIAFRDRLARGEEFLREPLPAGEPEPLVVDGEGLVIALRVHLGAGAVVLLADDDFLTNEGLRSAEHALLFVRLAELLRSPEKPLHFDEFALGGWKPAGRIELALAPRARSVTLHLLLLALLWGWMHAWPREFARDPLPLEQRSPLERARAQAGLLLRAGQHTFLGQRLRAGVLRRLARALRLTAREVERPEERRATLATLEARAPAGLRDAVRSLLGEHEVRDAGELAGLGSALMELERSLLQGDSGRSALFLDPRSGEDAAWTAGRT